MSRHSMRNCPWAEHAYSTPTHGLYLPSPLTGVNGLCTVRTGAHTAVTFTISFRIIIHKWLYCRLPFSARLNYLHHTLYFQLMFHSLRPDSSILGANWAGLCWTDTSAGPCWIAGSWGGSACGSWYRWTGAENRVLRVVGLVCVNMAGSNCICTDGC